jgi:hypothetical protein
MKLFTIVLAAALTIGTASAFSPDTITVHFAMPVLAGETVLPAGAVTITTMRGTNHVILTLRSHSGVAATLIANRISESSDRDPNPAVVLGRHGNDLKIERIWLGDHTGFAILPNVD